MKIRLMSRLAFAAVGPLVVLALPVSADATSGLPVLKRASAMTVASDVVPDGRVYREASEGARGEGQGGKSGPGSGGNSGGNGGGGGGGGSGSGK